MVEENIELPEELEAKQLPVGNDADQLFSKMSEIAPLRDEELEDEDFGKDGDGSDEHGTLEERIETGRKLTDFQTLDRRLNPDLGHDFLNLVSMGRVFPDNYNPMGRIFTKYLIKQGIAIPIAIARVNTALSIAIDGEGRLDDIFAYTKGSREATTEQNKGSGLG